MDNKAQGHTADLFNAPDRKTWEAGRTHELSGRKRTAKSPKQSGAAEHDDAAFRQSAMLAPTTAAGSCVLLPAIDQSAPHQPLSGPVRPRGHG